MAVDLAGRADQIWGIFPEFGETNSPAIYEGSKDDMALDPATTAALIDGGSKVLGGLLGGGSPGATSSASQYVNFSTGLNTVATSGSKATADQAIPWWVYAIGAVVVIKLFKRKKAA